MSAPVAALARKVFEEYSRAGGNPPDAHFDRNAAEQWMAHALEFAGVAELIEALEIARKQMAHRGCGRVRPTSEWAEHGSMSFDNCQCDIRHVDAIRARVRGAA